MVAVETFDFNRTYKPSSFIPIVFEMKANVINFYLLNVNMCIYYIKAVQLFTYIVRSNFNKYIFTLTENSDLEPPRGAAE